MEPYTTGFLVPTSEQDGSIMNIRSSSGAPSTVVQSAPTKKLKSTASHPGASSTQVGSPAVPALVVTTKNVELHTASQTNHSSSSSVSAASAASRLRRADLARAKLELAKARTLEAEALRRRGWLPIGQDRTS